MGGVGDDITPEDVDTGEFRETCEQVRLIKEGANRDIL